MGMATYYLKAIFDSYDAAVVVFRRLDTLLEDLVKLNEEWQRNRGNGSATTQINKLKKFKSWCLVHTYKFDPNDRSTNFLAGPLPDITNDFQLTVVDNELHLSDYVWHFTEWNGIVSWLFEQGAIKAGYISDEYIDYWNDINWNSLLNINKDKKPLME